MSRRVKGPHREEAEGGREAAQGAGRREEGRPRVSLALQRLARPVCPTQATPAGPRSQHSLHAHRFEEFCKGRATNTNPHPAAEPLCCRKSDTLCTERPGKNKWGRFSRSTCTTPSSVLGAPGPTSQRLLCCLDAFIKEKLRGQRLADSGLLGEVGLVLGQVMPWTPAASEARTLRNPTDRQTDRQSFLRFGRWAEARPSGLRDPFLRGGFTL